MIEAAALHKRYGRFEALNGVSFHVDRGEIVGLLGPNGAGKTTLIRILTAYHFPSSGSARVASFDVGREPHRVRQSVGYLPENAPLYDEMKVREYLGFIADARGLAGAARRERLDWAVEACGLTEMLSREIRRLSKGYRQRTGLAQAILHDPSVLILDEPTSGLDPNQIHEIRSLIRNLGAEKTVVLSTHILQEVEALCGRVLIMNRGTLIAEGSAEEIARGMKQGRVLRISVKGVLDAALAGTLGVLPGVHGVAGVKAGADRTDVDLAVGAEGDPSEAVYDWAVARGLKILGMRLEKTSLEDLFSRLTAGGRDPDA